MERKSRIRAMLAVAIGLCLFVGVQTAYADLLFDRGLPTTNLNNEVNPNRSNFAVLGDSYEVINPPSYQVYGDDFMIKGSGTYYIDHVLIWVVSGGTIPNGLKLIMGKAGGSLKVVSSSSIVTKVYYIDGQRYQRLSTGVFG
jgi:hypothetical protein